MPLRGLCVYCVLTTMDSKIQIRPVKILRPLWTWLRSILGMLLFQFCVGVLC